MLWAASPAMRNGLEVPSAMPALATITTIGEWIQSFKATPPRQRPSSFNHDRVMKAVTKGSGGK